MTAHSFPPTGPTFPGTPDPVYSDFQSSQVLRIHCWVAWLLWFSQPVQSFLHHFSPLSTSSHCPGFVSYYLWFRLLTTINQKTIFFSFASHQNQFSLCLVFFIHLFLAVLGHRCPAQAFSSCGERGRPFCCSTHTRPVTERGLWGARASAVAARRSRSTGSAVVVHGLNRPAASGLQFVCPALAGGSLSTMPPGESLKPVFILYFIMSGFLQKFYLI